MLNNMQVGEKMLVMIFTAPMNKATATIIRIQ
jgi:hypothetical protein